jgi:EAL domain-containing protein (putative c-di-GMP-specific phosphodiesterase class I)
VGIKVLYKGIETPEQFKFCASLKGDFYQGFLFAHPQPSMQYAVFNKVTVET